MLAGHTRSHGLNGAAYKVKHGLMMRTALVSREVSAKRSKILTKRPIHSVSALAKARSIYVRPRLNLNTEEERNERGKCLAQTAYRIILLAREIGHIPSKSEIAAAGIGQQSMLRAARAFGAKTHNEAMAMAGLPVNSKGHKKKWEEPMAWPKEYFRVDDIALEQRRS